MLMTEICFQLTCKWSREEIMQREEWVRERGSFSWKLIGDVNVDHSWWIFKLNYNIPTRLSLSLAAVIVNKRINPHYYWMAFRYHIDKLPFTLWSPLGSTYTFHARLFTAIFRYKRSQIPRGPFPRRRMSRIRSTRAAAAEMQSLQQ